VHTRAVTCATAVVILDPPEAPTIILTFDPLTMMVGVMEDWGLLRGWRKFGLDGGRSKELFLPGKLKSSISSLKMIPLVGERIRLPKLCLDAHEEVERNRRGEIEEN